MGYGSGVRIQIAEGSDKEETMNALKHMISCLEENWEEKTDPGYSEKYPGSTCDELSGK